MLKIRDLAVEEIPVLKDFAPPEWNVDLSAVFGRHFGQPYFHPIAAELDGRIVGCANGLLHGSAGWLGNIVVLPEFRGRGVGHHLTENLIAYFHSQCVEHQLLVATNMGEPIYRKLGFTVSSYYIFFSRAGGSAEPCTISAVRPFELRDEAALLALDRAVTGERRPVFLRRCLADAWVHVDRSGELDGYYLPAVGTGLLIAADDGAGIALLEHRLGQPGSTCVAPERNAVAIEFLLQHGYVETSRAPRMTLGPEIDWRPERVYCRGSGFCG
jgi:ribosomal protein S18 acetylase RimI-like enzyme